MEPSLRSPPPRLHRRATTPLRVYRRSPNRRRTSLASRLYRRTNTNTASISYLQVQKLEWNHDITDDILSRLSVKSLARFKCVCKDWQRTMSSPFFVRAQRQKRGLKLTGFIVQELDYCSSRYIPVDTSGGKVQPMLFSLLPRDALVLASCNGLICYRSSREEPYIYVCNPVHRQLIKLSSLESSIAIASDFDGSCIETFPKFKLVKVRMSFSQLTFEVYSPETGAWRMLNGTCKHFVLRNGVICVRGILYWLTLEETILVFDVEKELARLISSPLTCESSILYHIIGESEGTMHHVLLTATLGLRIWCLENYSEEKWTLKYNESSDKIQEEYQRCFPSSGIRVPVQKMFPLGFKDWVLLLKVNDDVIVYDIKNNKMARACSFRDFFPRPRTVLSYSMSLVPLNDA